MGMVRHDAYTLLVQGEGVLEFINGLSTNLVDGPCTTVFTNRAAQIIDVCDVIPVGANVALVGYNPCKSSLIEHLSQRILGQAVSISDISHLNDVFLGLEGCTCPEGTTVHASFSEPCTSYRKSMHSQQPGRKKIGRNTALTV